MQKRISSAFFLLVWSLAAQAGELRAPRFWDHPLKNVFGLGETYRRERDAHKELSEHKARTEKSLEALRKRYRGPLKDEDRDGSRSARDEMKTLKVKALQDLAKVDTRAEMDAIRLKYEADISALVDAYREEKKIEGYTTRLERAHALLSVKEPGAAAALAQAETQARARLQAARDHAERNHALETYETTAREAVAKAKMERQAREMRFDPNSTTQVTALAQAAADLIGKAASQTLDAGALASALSRNADLRAFAYRELQFFRRASRADIARRASLDVRLLQAAIATGDATPVLRARALRDAVRRSNRPEHFQGLLVKGETLSRRLTVSETEALVEAALTNETLAGVVLGASIVLPAVPQAPRKPAVPDTTVPMLPARPSALSSYDKRRRFAVEQYNTAVTGYKRAVEKIQAVQAEVNAYNEAVTAYRTKYPEYARRMQVFAQLQGRRHSARTVLLAHLATQFPGALGANAAKIQKKVRKEVAKAKASLPKPEQRRIEASAGVRREDDTTASDWFYYAYTQNPMWLINRNFAMAQLVMDSVSHHAPVSAEAAPANEALLRGFGVEQELVSTALATPPSLDALPAEFRELAESTALENIQAELPAHLSEDALTLHVDSLSPWAATELQSAEIPFDVRLDDVSLPATLDVQELSMPSYGSGEALNFETPATIEYSAPAEYTPSVEYSTPSYDYSSPSDTGSSSTFE